MFQQKNLINNLIISYKYFNKKKIKNYKVLIYYTFNNIIFFNNILLKKIILNKTLLSNNIKNKLKYFEIEKGLKKKRIGIYLRNFSKDFFYIENIQKYCYLIIRFVRKNLFLTLLNKDGNVICKTNIGSCGFKKKVKFTGYAIKRTSKKFSKKILKLFIKTIYLIHKNFEKTNIKENLTFVKNLNLLLKDKKVNFRKKLIKLHKLKDKKIEKINKRKINFEEQWFNLKKKKIKKKRKKKSRKIIKFLKNNLIISKKKISKFKTNLSKEDNEKRRLNALINLNKNEYLFNKVKNKNLNFIIRKFNYLNKSINNKIIILKKGNILAFIKNKKLNYRNYLYYQNKILDNFNIKIRIKSSLKFWGFKFIMYGLGKKFYWFKGLEVKIPVPHSEGLRLRKKRRV